MARERQSREQPQRHAHRVALIAVAAVILVTAGVIAFSGDDPEPGSTPVDVAVAQDAIGGSDLVGVGSHAESTEPLAGEAALELATDAAVPAVPEVEPEYVVQPGDYLGRIATDRNCKTAEIMLANGLRNDRILVGQKLKLPAACGGVDVETAPLDAAPHWSETGVDTTTLAGLMAEHGFRPPADFKAFVIEVTFDPTRRYIVAERAFDWKGTSDDVEGWNPASAIKLFPAIAALKRIEAEGFSSRATVEFHARHGERIQVSELVRKAIIDSDNIAYNRLMQLAGFDNMHEVFFTPQNGFSDTALMRPYYKSIWVDEMGEENSLRYAPDISLEEDGREHTFEGGRGDADTGCGSAACTTLQDLAEANRRLLLQEQLPAEDAFGLAFDDLIMLRKAMRAERARGNQMVDRFAAAFGDDNVKFYSKPGFSRGWFSDNAYIYDPNSSQAWIVAMAGWEGRDSLNDAAVALGEVIVSGKLARAKHVPTAKK